MMAASATAPLANDPNPAGLVEVLLNISPTGIMLLRPLYAATGEEILDFAWEQLNPAAQRMLQLPVHPASSFLTLYPTASEVGVFQFYCAAFRSGQLEQRKNLYQHDGLDGYYTLTAQRHGELLVVNFTDGNDQSRTDIEEALRQSQAREQAARQAAERQRADLERAFEQAPVAFALFRGPELVVEFANPELGLMLGLPVADIMGQPIFEMVPAVRGQGLEELLSNTYTQGTPYNLLEVPVHFDREREGRPEQGYFNITYRPEHDAQGAIIGVVYVGVEVTTQVLARQEVQALNEELAASNAEYLHANTALTASQHELTALTQELDSRVQERTHQLAEQQSLLSHILRQVPAAVATLLGPDHRFAFFNEQYLALSGHRAALNRTVAEVMPEVDGQGFLALLDRVYTTGEPYVGKEIAIVLEQPSGPVIHYLDFTYQALTDGQGQVQGILVFALDVTEQVRMRRQADTLQAAVLAAAQRRAQHRQELYQIFAQTPVAIVLLREPDHRIDYFNRAFEELFPPEEWSGGALQGHTIGEVYPRVKMAGLVELLDRVYTTGEPQVLIELPLADLQPGSRRYVTLSYQAYWEEEHIVGVAAFAYDVTEQVLGRQQVEAQQAELRDIFEQAPVAICMFRGEEYVLELVNPLMGEMLGHDPAHVLNKPFFEALPELQSQGLRQVLDEVRRTGAPFVAQEQPIRLARHSPGEFGYFNFVYQPLRGATGLTAVVCVATEVTAQVQARQQVQGLNEELAAINEEMQATNEELHESNTRLTRTNADLDTFVYSASHDLKAPITNIEGLLLALRRQLPPEALQTELIPRLLDMMGGAVSRFQQTLGHLTDVTRLQHDLLAQPMEAVDLPALVEAVRLDILPELTAANATLTVDLASPPTLYCSAKTLRSILYNLLSNAVKYHHPERPPLVQLRCRAAEASQLVLEVQDNGLGLSEPQQKELFRLFRRLHSHVPGSGVGLYMVKKMVDNAGGTLSVQSQPDMGSTFTVTLPAAHPPRT
jgi:PAS domain S-box-containing protein